MFEAQGNVPTAQDAPSADPSPSSSEMDVDALYESMMNGGSEAQPEPTQAAPTQEAPQPQTPTEFEFNYNGKAIKVPYSDPRTKQWLSQGYDYAQRIQAFNQERQKWEQERKQVDEIASRYREVDEYTKQNPEWWDFVNSQYQQQIAQKQNSNQPQVDPNHPLLKEVSTIKEKLTKYEEAEQQKRIAEEDQKLQQEIQSIRGEYPDLGWDAPGQDGKTLEIQVLDFGIKHNLPDFKSAFLVFNHERLAKRAEERGKEAAIKERQKQTKLGLLGSSPTPKKGITDARNLKNKSYDQLYQESLEELGLA